MHFQLTPANKDLSVIDVPNAETQFDIDEFNDLYSRTKPTLYIKMADIFSIHHLVAADASYICPTRDDILQEVIRELGNVKNNEHELMTVSSSEISLTLNPKLHQAEGRRSDYLLHLIWKPLTLLSRSRC